MFFDGESRVKGIWYKSALNLIRFFLAATEANGCMKSNPAPAIVVINRLHKSLLQTNSSHGVNCIRRERGGERERERKKKTDKQTNRQTDKQTAANKLASYNGKTFPRRGHVERVEVARVRNGQSVFRCSASFQTRPPPAPEPTVPSSTPRDLLIKGASKDPCSLSRSWKSEVDRLT